MVLSLVVNEESSAMSFGRIAVIATLLWVGAITFLHATLNWGLFEQAPARREARAKFKIGYLPVT
jgi:hypothetical protein